MSEISEQNEKKIGYKYKEAKDEAEKLLVNNSELKITYGTKSEKFHFMESDDRDYDVWGIKLEDFIKTKTEDEAINICTSPRRLSSQKEKENLEHKMEVLFSVKELNKYLSGNGKFVCNNDCTNFFIDVYDLNEEEANLICKYTKEKIDRKLFNE